MSEETLERLWTKLAAAEACWFGTVRPDGRPHLAPIWHACHAGKIFVVSQPDAVRARNIAQNPAVTISLPDPMNALIVEGAARAAPEAEAALHPLFQAKYNWDIRADTSYRLIIGVTPRKIMAWGDHGAALGTGRWHFDADGNLLPSAPHAQRRSQSGDSA